MSTSSRWSAAGFDATVAPLGTALTADQLALLWKMADEPVLCFDGDGAGRRAAYRAVDLALPQLKPGKSLQIRQPARRPGPRRSRARGRPRGGRGGSRRRAAAGRDALDARNRGRRLRYAGTARGAAKRTSARSSRRSATSRCATTTGRISTTRLRRAVRRRERAVARRP